MTQHRALVVRGGWDGHDPIGTTDAIIPGLRDRGYEVVVADSPAVYTDADRMREVDVVVQSVTMSTITDDEARGLADAVRAGTGLAGWHGGIADSFRASTQYLQLIGGQFVDHPAGPRPEERRKDGTDAFVRHTIDIVPERADHPIVAGIESFELDTEQYWVLTDAYDDVLATTTIAARDWEPWHEPVTCPAVWTRRWGAGRVFVATPGHTVDVLTHPDVRTILERGIEWATR